ncbi:hypothetical protein C4F49_02980 [Sphingobacterium sp. KB22]|uniref:Uncharacterized protein n=1 Tax=Sphingobacterium hungaricum TaxID=2082723 RepID=A0A928YP19_9SPHI|nr:hypothetical protein [Sphingobacterium hungaricum]
MAIASEDFRWGLFGNFRLKILYFCLSSHYRWTAFLRADFKIYKLLFIVILFIIKHKFYYTCSKKKQIVNYRDQIILDPMFFRIASA